MFRWKRHTDTKGCEWNMFTVIRTAAGHILPAELVQTDYWGNIWFLSTCVFVHQNASLATWPPSGSFNMTVTRCQTGTGNMPSVTNSGRRASSLENDKNLWGYCQWNDLLKERSRDGFSDNFLNEFPQDQYSQLSSWPRRSDVNFHVRKMWQTNCLQLMEKQVKHHVTSKFSGKKLSILFNQKSLSLCSRIHARRIQRCCVGTQTADALRLSD